MEDESIIVHESQMQFKNMNKVPAELLIERATALGGRDDVDAVVLSCCDMPTLDAIPRIETAIGKPVTSSVQALFWSATRAAGITERAKGKGRLLAEY
jgi:maleate cis-trans isomerase